MDDTYSIINTFRYAGFTRNFMLLAISRSITLSKKVDEFLKDLPQFGLKTIKENVTGYYSKT